MNRILNLDTDKKTVRVQPGVIHSELNAYLKSHGLLYGPDPATSTRANMGGIVANNSSGSRSIVFGKAIDHIHSMRVALANGDILELQDLSQEALNEKLKTENREGEIYRTLKDIISEDREIIIEKFPKVMRRVSGYSLDEFVNGSDWNLGKLICGSEGTLATILEVTVKLVDLPRHRGVCTIHYHDRMEAISEVKHLLRFSPSAVELLDYHVIDIAKTNPSTRDMAYFIEGNPGAILIVEFFGDSMEEVREKYEALTAYLQTESYSYSAPFYGPGSTYEHIWELRKKGLGLLLSMRSAAKPIPFIEDACVPVESLADYIGGIMEFCQSLDTNVILYAHASVGVLHVRPILNLRDAVDIDKFRKIADHTLNLVIKFKGSWSGEHGDGISRSFGIPKFFGDKIYSDFVRIKKAFDPGSLMNPGKIVDAPDPTSHLRYGANYRDQSVHTIYHYRKELGFDNLIHMCNGIGVCQRVSGGVMCPSYKASLDEKDSTRGRANLLRLTLSGQLFQGDFTDPALWETLALCISCKSCKTECPSNVDVAKLKSEVMQMRHDRFGLSLRGRFILWSDRFSAWFSGPLSKIINPVISSRLFRKVLQSMAGIDARRMLDPYAGQSLSTWFKREFKPTASGDQVVLFADTYLNYHHTGIGKSVVGILDAMDCRVTLVNTGGSGRPLISNGFLRKARTRGQRIAQQLQSYLDKGIPVIVCEPSDFSALSEDIPDLLGDENLAEKLHQGTISLERFLAKRLDHWKGKGKLTSDMDHHLIHAHCHQKALEGTDMLKRIFDRVENCSYEILDAGCCGMAGAFGFEKEHYDFSKRIFEEDLGKKLQDLPSDQPILASGFSCRHQIADLGGRKVRHWVEVLKFERHE